MADKLGALKQQTTQRQEKDLQVLLTRITNDKNEQLRHRRVDSERMLQRDKNMMHDLLNKHKTEQRRTIQFLQFALGNRSNKAPAPFGRRNRSLDIDSSSLSNMNKRSRN
jgi:hypothetical protein